MSPQGLFSRGLFLAAAMVGLATISRTTLAQERPPDVPSAGSSATGGIVPESTLNSVFGGPALRETGRVATTEVTDPGVDIERRRDFAVPVEATVRVTGPTDDGRGIPTAGGAPTFDVVALEHEIRAHMASLLDCRVDVARTQRVLPQEVEAAELLIRWTILSSGGVSGPAVVATQPIDPAVASCVKQRMTSWRFSPLAGASAEIERVLVFPR